MSCSHFFFFPPKAIFSNIIHSQLSVIILQSYRCIVQVISNRFMIYSFHLYLNSLKLLHSFANSYPMFLFLLIVLFNFYGGMFKISFPYQFIRYFNSTGGSLKTFSSLRHMSLNPSNGNKWFAIRCLSAIKLKTSNGFDILLILVKGQERYNINLGRSSTNHR